MKKIFLLVLLNCGTICFAVPAEVMQKIKDHEKQVLNKTYKFLKKKKDGTLIFQEKSYFDDGSMEKRKITNYNLPDDNIPVKIGIYGRFKKVLPSRQKDLIKLSFETANVAVASLMLYGLITLDDSDIDEYEKMSAQVTKNPLAWMSGLGALASLARIFLTGNYVLFGDDYVVVPKQNEKEKIITTFGILQFIKNRVW